METNRTETPVTHEELVRFFGVLAHDLKSPIFAIDGFSDLLLSDYLSKLDEEGQDFLRRIRSSAQYMRRVLDDMSHLVKLLSRPTAKRSTPLRELIEEVIQKHSYAIEDGGVKINVSGELPTLDIDPDKTREALGAVLGNAIFFNDRPKGERAIDIDCAREDGCYRIRIRDNGIGIDPRYVSQIFDLGSASKLDKQRGGGPGYGLYLAKRLLESNGGALSVESEPGSGSTFSLTVPT